MAPKKITKRDLDPDFYTSLINDVKGGNLNIDIGESAINNYLGSHEGFIEEKHLASSFITPLNQRISSLESEDAKNRKLDTAIAETDLSPELQQKIENYDTAISGNAKDADGNEISLASIQKEITDLTNKQTETSTKLNNHLNDVSSDTAIDDKINKAKDTLNNRIDTVDSDRKTQETTLNTRVTDNESAIQKINASLDTFVDVPTFKNNVDQIATTVNSGAIKTNGNAGQYIYVRSADSSSNCSYVSARDMIFNVYMVQYASDATDLTKKLLSPIYVASEDTLYTYSGTSYSSSPSSSSSSSGDSSGTSGSSASGGSSESSTPTSGSSSTSTTPTTDDSSSTTPTTSGSSTTTNGSSTTSTTSNDGSSTTTDSGSSSTSTTGDSPSTSTTTSQFTNYSSMAAASTRPELMGTLWYNQLKNRIEGYLSPAGKFVQLASDKKSEEVAINGSSASEIDCPENPIVNRPDIFISDDSDSTGTYKKLVSDSGKKVDVSYSASKIKITNNEASQVKLVIVHQK